MSDNVISKFADFNSVYKICDATCQKPGSSHYLIFAINPLLSNCIGKLNVFMQTDIYV